MSIKEEDFEKKLDEIIGVKKESTNVESPKKDVTNKKRERRSIDKTTKPITIGIVFILCFFGGVGATYYFKDREINSMTTDYEEEILDITATYSSNIQQLQIEKDDIQNQYDDLQSQLGLTYKDAWDYTDKMLNGYFSLSTAMKNEGLAMAYYDEAGVHYDEYLFDWAEIYAGYADTYYAYASNEYRGAKAFFNSSKQYAIDDNSENLADLHYDLCELGAQIMDEMHQANEYFASACHSYYNGIYETGDAQIETMNEHIRNHDDLVPDFNDVWSEIEALLD